MNTADCKLQFRWRNCEARDGSSSVSGEKQDNVVPDHFLLEEATRTGNIYHKSLGGPDMMTTARTFLSLIYYNSWLRHGRKLELIPCSACNVHKLYLLLQRVKARSSITSTFCFLCQRVFNKGYSSRLLQTYRGKVALQHLSICTDVVCQSPINPNCQPIRATRIGPQARETSLLSLPLYFCL